MFSCQLRKNTVFFSLSLSSLNRAFFPVSLLLPLPQVLQLIYWSRNGLTVCELSQLTALPPCALLYLLRELKRRAILAEIGGLYHLSHDQVGQ